MEYEVSGVIKDVRIALDLNITSEPMDGFGDEDTLSLSELIESKIEDGARIATMGAPSHLLGQGKRFGNSIRWHQQGVGRGSGSILLPEDFMRLARFSMSDWSCSVTSAITDEHPDYSKQKSKFLGVRGNPDRPVVAIVDTPAGKVLEFYSSYGGKNVYVQSSYYIPYPKIKDGKIDLCDRLYRGIVYYIAHLVASVVGTREQADMLAIKTKELLELQ